MNRRHLLQTLGGLALCPACTASVQAADDAKWAFEGSLGPEKWGDLDPAYKACAIGTQQSPIDIAGPIKSELPPLKIAWAKGADTVVNNGHTIQVNIADGSTLTLGKNSYKLLQFHFHRPSEHKINGKSFPMEVHFVHATPSGALAVIGVMMTEGKRNATFSKLVATMPRQAGPAVKADPAINPAGLLPAKKTYYRYRGSLTTPPCSETVEWLVLSSPIEVAASDVAGFAQLYAMNARPLQQLNRRMLLWLAN